MSSTYKIIIICCCYFVVFLLSIDRFRPNSSHFAKIGIFNLAIQPTTNQITNNSTNWILRFFSFLHLVGQWSTIYNCKSSTVLFASVCAACILELNAVGQNFIILWNKYCACSHKIISMKENIQNKNVVTQNIIDGMPLKIGVFFFFLHFSITSKQRQ